MEMIKGMTGFGQALFSKGKIKGAVEIKSVNHKYLDVTYYLPNGFGSIEGRIKNVLQKDVQRGRVTVSLKFLEKPETTINLHKETVRLYLAHMRSLQKEFKLQGSIGLGDVLHLPGVFESKDVIITPESIWPDVEKAFRRAVKALTDMRKKEGQSIVRDMTAQLKQMSASVVLIKARAKIILDEKKKNLNSEEVTSFQKSNDVNEEIERLSHYVVEVRGLLKKNEAGKQVDFYAQEMHREINTIGSKIQDKIVSQHVVGIKSLIDKIREQAQNIE